MAAVHGARSRRGFAWVLARGCAVVVGGMLGLGACEIALRVIDVPISKNTKPDLYDLSSNPQLLYTLKPGFAGFAYGAWVNVNRLGFRGAEIDAAAGEELRIALIGDSIAFGYGLEEDDTLARRLEQELRSIGGSERLVRVLNLGTPGYTLGQELELLRLRGSALHPDLVVLVTMSNDADPPPNVPRTLARASGWRAWIADLRAAGRAHSRAWSAIEHGVIRLVVTDPNLICPLHDPRTRALLRELDLWDDRQRTTLSEALEGFARALQRAGTPWILAYWGRPGGFESALTAFTERRAVAYVPLQMAYEQGLDDPAYTLRWDSHPSALAARVMARTLALAIAVQRPELLRIGPGDAEEVRSRLQAQSERWASWKSADQESRREAIDAIPASVAFPSQDGAVPWGVVWGIDAEGELRLRSNRIVLRGAGDAVEISGEADPDARLLVSAAPRWESVEIDTSRRRFSARLPLAEPRRARDYVKIALRSEGGIRLDRAALSGSAAPLEGQVETESDALSAGLVRRDVVLQPAREQND